MKKTYYQYIIMDYDGLFVEVSNLYTAEQLCVECAERLIAGEKLGYQIFSVEVVE